ncbi:Slx4p interacting protein [Trapelia coarctata]|nr:Slx4p interacting protein [Trapelia coarctata]
MSLPDKLRNLHLLLRVPSFARWPLQLRFFSADVYASWLKWTKQSNTGNKSGPIIILDFGQPEGLTIEGSGVQNLPVNYLPLKSHLQKSLSILAEGKILNCSICRGNIDASAASTVICPGERCSAASHVKCLASKFIKDEGLGNVIPTAGHCPNCNATLQWIDLVRETSLRMRGPKEIAKLMKAPRKRRVKDAPVSLSDSVSEEARFADIDEFDEEDTDDEGDIDIADVVDEPLVEEGRYRMGSDEDEDDMMSVTSAVSEASKFSRPGSPEKLVGQVARLGIVIEDSDWDNAEVLD